MDHLSVRAKRALAYFTHALATRPQFIAYFAQDLPSALTDGGNAGSSSCRC